MYDDDFVIRLGSGQASMDPDEVIKKFVTAKASEWSYECEWRVVLHSTNLSQPTEDLAFSREELAAVYLGCRILKNYEEEIVAKIHHEYSRTKIFVAEKMERKFALRFRDY